MHLLKLVKTGSHKQGVGGESRPSRSLKFEFLWSPQQKTPHPNDKPINTSAQKDANVPAEVRQVIGPVWRNRFVRLNLTLTAVVCGARQTQRFSCGFAQRRASVKLSAPPFMQISL